jgi:hypothetical protein
MHVQQWITQYFKRSKLVEYEWPVPSPGTKVRGKLSYQGRGRHTFESTQNLDGMTIKPFIEILRS